MVNQANDNTALADTTCQFVTRNGCCRTTRLTGASKKTKPVMFSVTGNMLAECVEVCEQDPKCIAYEFTTSKKRNSKSVDMCQHFMDDTFISANKVSRASKSCRKRSVCGSQDFGIPTTPTPTPSPTPTNCTPVREERTVYKPMDNVAAGRTGKPKKGINLQSSRTVEASAEACFERCEKTDGCARINFFTRDGGCHLVASGAKGTPSKKVTAIGC
jgi:hypothetical protein